MALLEWDEKFSVLVPELDEEHKKLVIMINSLHDAMKTGKGKDILPQTLDYAAEYALKHFAHEEMLMVKYRYPDYANHKKAHDEFVQKVGVYKEQLNSKTLQAVQLMKVLQEWLVSHILQIDQKYSLFLAKAMKR